MDEYIKREVAMREACKGCNIEFDDQPCEPSDCYIRKKLISLPAADVVAVVRCKDCKHGGLFSVKKRLVDCPYYDDQMVDFDHFCSYGERRGDDEL